MTKTQALWAARHDWFEGVTVDANGVYTVVVREESHHDATGWTTTILSFVSFTALRDWAGY